MIHIVILELIVICSLIALCIMQYVKHKNYKHTMTHNLYVAQILYDSTKAKMEDLQRSLSEKENAVNTDVKEMLASRFKTIDELCLTYYENMGSHKEKEKIYSQVRDIIDGIRTDDKIIASLEDIVNTKMNNLIKDLKCDFPDMKDADKRLFFVYCARFFKQSNIDFPRYKN